MTHNIVFQRHWISNPNHVESLRKGIDRTIEASEKVDWTLGIRIAHPKKVASKEYKDAYESMTKELSRLKSHDISFFVEPTTGSGGSYNGAGASLYSNLFGHFMTHMSDKRDITSFSMEGGVFQQALYPTLEEWLNSLLFQQLIFIKKVLLLV